VLASLWAKYAARLRLDAGIVRHWDEVIHMKESQTPESESAELAEDAIARVALPLTGKERASTLLSQIGESPLTNDKTS
jgi:hypothetical protein